MSQETSRHEDPGAALMVALGHPSIMAALQLGTDRAQVAAPAELVSIDPGAEERWPRIAAALLGQASRFRRPEVPHWADIEPFPRSEGPFLTDAERFALRRLGESISGYDGRLGILRRFLASSPRSVHPFDVRALGPLLEGASIPFESKVIAWFERFSRGANRTLDAGEGPTMVSPENWSSQTPSTQTAYLQAVRAQDPAAGREFVESALEGMAAATRCRLVEALGTGLSTDDAPFLESLSSDRARSVKSAAADLLARIPGTTAYAEALENSVRHIVRVKAGALRQKTALKLKPIPRVHGDGLGFAKALLQDLRLEDLADALELSVKAMFEGAAKDVRLQTALMSRALREGVEAVKHAAPLLPDVDVWSCIPNDAIENPTPAVAAALPLLFRPSSWDGWPAVHQLAHVLDAMGGPLPNATAAELLGCRALEEALTAARTQPENDGSWLVPLVGLVPVSLFPALEALIETLPPHQASTTLELLRLGARLLAEDPSHD